MVRDSHWVGLTFPGMMDEPGSFSGKDNSPNPDLGPDPKNLISLEILWREQANVFKEPDNSTIASFPDKASNLLGAVTNLYPVSSETYSATFSAYPI